MNIVRLLIDATTASAPKKKKTKSAARSENTTASQRSHADAYKKHLGHEIKRAALPAVDKAKRNTTQDAIQRPDPQRCDGTTSIKQQERAESPLKVSTLVTSKVPQVAFGLTSTSLAHLVGLTQSTLCGRRLLKSTWDAVNAAATQHPRCVQLLLLRALLNYEILDAKNCVLDCRAVLRFRPNNAIARFYETAALKIGNTDGLENFEVSIKKCLPDASMQRAAARCGLPPSSVTPHILVQQPRVKASTR